MIKIFSTVIYNDVFYNSKNDYLRKRYLLLFLLLFLLLTYDTSL